MALNGVLSNFITIPDTARMAYLESLAEDDMAWQRMVGEYRDYYAGDHEVQLTERQIEFLGRATAYKFRLNQCPVVVESLVERLALTGFEEIGVGSQEPGVGGQDAGTGESVDQSKGLTEFASKLWEDNRLDAGQEEIYRQAAIDQRTYVALDVDPLTGLITLNHNDAYSCGKAGGDEEGIKLHYANARRRGKPLFATKRWAATLGRDAGYRRYFYVYYPDRIERYYQDDREKDGGDLGQMGWKRLIDAAGPMAGVWPLPWTDALGRPLGIPVVEFVNGRAGELHEAVPLQRALNKSVIDLIAAADQAGFGILFASGWAPTSDGKPIALDSGGRVISGNKPLTLESGAILYTTNPEGQLSRVAGDDLDKLIRVVDRHILSIAQVTRTPITNFQLFGQIPGADTQKQLDQGLVAKVQSRQRGYGNAWEDVVYLARAMALGAPMYQDGQIVGYGLPAYEGFTLDLATRVSALWKDAVIRNEKEHLEALKLKKELGVPQEQIYLEMGYEAEQADKWAMEAEARRVDALDRMMSGGQGAGAGGQGSADQQGGGPGAQGGMDGGQNPAPTQR